MVGSFRIPLEQLCLRDPPGQEGVIIVRDLPRGKRAHEVAEQKRLVRERVALDRNGGSEAGHIGRPER